MLSPLRFEIEYHTPNREQSNLDIFLSTIEKSPDNRTCEMKQVCPNNFYVFSHKIGKTNLADIY